MKKLGTKIISYFLLLNFLAISFPIQEFFHNHEKIVTDCFDSDEHTNELNHSRKCYHQGHFTEKKEKHICFYTYFNSPYIVTGVISIDFKKIYVYNFLLQNIEKHYLKSFPSYLLRGPPSCLI